MAKIVWKISRQQMIDAWFAPALEAVVDELAAVFDDVMDSEIWTWDRPTTRRANPAPGAVVTSPRSISDSGQLRQSQQKIQSSSMAFALLWAEAYALKTLIGFRRKDGTTAPARDWIMAGLSQVDVIELYAAEIKAKMN